VPVDAQEWDGRYELDACSGGLSAETRIELRWPQIRFYESVCQLSAPEPIAGLGDAVIADATCQGEGETWTRRILFMTSLDGGLVMVRDGLALTYARCG